MLARRMFKRSISRTLAAPTPIASARARTTRASRLRFAGAHAPRSWSRVAPRVDPGRGARGAHTFEGLAPLLAPLAPPHHLAGGAPRIKCGVVGLDPLPLDRPYSIKDEDHTSKPHPPD